MLGPTYAEGEDGEVGETHFGVVYGVLFELGRDIEEAGGEICTGRILSEWIVMSLNSKGEQYSYMLPTSSTPNLFIHGRC